MQRKFDDRRRNWPAAYTGITCWFRFVFVYSLITNRYATPCVLTASFSLFLYTPDAHTLQLTMDVLNQSTRRGCSLCCRLCVTLEMKQPTENEPIQSNFGGEHKVWGCETDQQPGMVGKKSNDGRSQLQRKFSAGEKFIRQLTIAINAQFQLLFY